MISTSMTIYIVCMCVCVFRSLICTEERLLQGNLNKIITLDDKSQLLFLFCVTMYPHETIQILFPRL